PSVVVEYVERSGRKGEARLDVPKIAVDRPQALAVQVRAGKDGIARLDLRVKGDTEKDERDAYGKSAADERVDRTIISPQQGGAVLRTLSRLRAAGLYRSALSYADLGTIRVAAVLEHDAKPSAEIVTNLEANGTPAPWPDIEKLMPSTQPA